MRVVMFIMFCDLNIESKEKRKTKDKIVIIIKRIANMFWPGKRRGGEMVAEPREKVSDTNRR